jgi:hypothetical protein
VEVMHVAVEGLWIVLENPLHLLLSVGSGPST